METRIFEAVLNIVTSFLIFFIHVLSFFPDSERSMIFFALVCEIFLSLRIWIVSVPISNWISYLVRWVFQLMPSLSSYERIGHEMKMSSIYFHRTLS